MTDQEINIAISEACGWKYKNPAPDGEIWPGWALWMRPDGAYMCNVPNYLKDRNAIHEAINALDASRRLHFLHHLDLITLRRSSDWFPSRIVTATLSEYCEAFLLTVGK